MGTAWFSRRAVAIHLTALVVVPGCLALGWWQVSRALGGNNLSWAYAVEWPFFAVYGVYLWWRLVHEQPSAVTGAADHAATAADRAEPAPLSVPGAAAPAPPPTPVTAASSAVGDPEQQEDDELAAYNRYLAELAAIDKPKRW